MIDKAVIPVAGLGTRIGALARVVPKAMFPLVDADGIIRPVIHCICAEAASAGVSQAIIVVLRQHLRMIRQYLAELSRDDRKKLPPEIQFIPAEPLGFGHAVLAGAKAVRNEPFMVFLGDHVHQADKGFSSCAAQVVRAHKACPGAAMIGMQPVGQEELPKVGVVGGDLIKDGIYRCRAFIEKPTLAAARAKLRTPGLRGGQFLAHAGIYVFSPEILDCLRAVRDKQKRGRELSLAEAQAVLLARNPESYYLVRIHGRAYDTGTPAGYLAAQQAMI